jgi:hypothetical protein
MVRRFLVELAALHGLVTRSIMTRRSEPPVRRNEDICHRGISLAWSMMLSRLHVHEGRKLAAPEW